MTTSLSYAAISHHMQDGTPVDIVVSYRSIVLSIVDQIADR